MQKFVVQRAMNALACVVRCENRLGEGPCWSPMEGRLYWFDIKSLELHWLAPDTGRTGLFRLPMRASAATPRRAGGLLLATEQGLAVIDTATGEVRVVQPVELEPGFRTNDGKIDPAGNFWWSTMDDHGGERAGAVFRTRPGMVTERVIEGIHIANTVSVSADGRRLYLADSMLGKLFVHDTADLSQVREFATTSEGVSPDGSAIDAEGFLWNVQWGGWRIVRYAPDGRVDRVVETPVAQPTSCAFGGPELSTLYVTSAWDGLSAEDRARQPLAGALFALEPGVRGMPLPLFAG